MFMALLMSILTRDALRKSLLCLHLKYTKWFYVQDPYGQDKYYVMQTVPRDLFNMGDEVESNRPQSYENEPSEHSKGQFIPKDNVEVLLKRIY